MEVPHMFQIDLKSRKSIYEQVVDNLRGLIVSGSLSPDEKLPSVRDLSRALTVNPNTVQKAYRQLENLKYIYTVSGLGTFVSDLKETAPDPQKIGEIKSRVRADIMELFYLGLPRGEIENILKQLLEERGEIK
jgi:GntR family transcriptional regulator